MMRVEDPNGAWKAHPDDARLMTPRDAGRGARGRHVLPAALGGPDPELRRRPDQGPAPARRPRPEPQLPGRVEARGRAVRRRAVPALRAGDARAHGGDRRAAEHHRLHRVPHVLGRPSSAVRRLRRRPLPDDGPARVQADRRRGDEADRLSRRSRSSTSSSTTRRPRSRARRRTGSTTTSASTRGRRSSGARSARRASRTTATSSG